MTTRVPVCVFAKPPVVGEAKTRLARHVGANAAARLARAFFEDTWAVVRDLPWARPILATTTPDVTAFGERFAHEDVEVWMQGDGDLGARMERVLARAVGEAGRAIGIGSDLPGLPAAHLEAARAALETHDAVLGPADDGGFWLLGLSRVPEGLLRALPWSAPDTLARTERRLAELGLACARAPGWFDVDEAHDLVRVLQLLEQDSARAPRTFAAVCAREGG